MSNDRPKSKQEPSYDLEEAKILINSDMFLLIGKADREAHKDFKYNDFEVGEEIKTLKSTDFIESKLGDWELKKYLDVYIKKDKNMYIKFFIQKTPRERLIITSFHKARKR